MSQAQGEVVAPAGRPGFVAGVKCLFGGIWWTISTPGVWPLALVPILLGLLLTSLLGALSIGFVPGWIGDVVDMSDSILGTVGTVVLQVLATLLAVVASALVGFALAQPLSGPALEGIVRRKERDLGAPERPESSLGVEIWRSLQSLGVSYMFGLPTIVLLLVLSILVPHASIVLFPLKLVVAALTIAWDICDYPLSVRGLPMGERVGTIIRHRGAVLGFSIGLALAGLVPCLLFLVLPGGVAGAAKLMWEIEVYERTHARDMDGIRRQVGG
jgi:CysZ protein